MSKVTEWKDQFTKYPFEDEDQSGNDRLCFPSFPQLISGKTPERFRTAFEIVSWMENVQFGERQESDSLFY